MRTVCLLKQAPRPDRIEFDEETKSLRREGVPLARNPFDAAVIELPHVPPIPAVAGGRDYGPRVAGELELGMAGDCVGLGIDRGGRLLRTEPAYGGRTVSVITGATTPQLATVRTRMFEPLEPRERDAEVIPVQLGPPPEPRLRLADRDEEPAGDLDEADVAVCAGPGLDAAEVERLVAGRAAVGLQGTGSSRRIGLYGRPVAPRVYAPVGRDGGLEHEAGPVEAGAVVAVACDAALHRAAGAVLAGDRREPLPAVLDGL